jgi:hypothetical protein
LGYLLAQFTHLAKKDITWLKKYFCPHPQPLAHAYNNGEKIKAVWGAS